MPVNRQPIPADMERAVRRKSYYGCVCCGCPIVDYHHIIPYSDVKEHTEENLVALCCNCHRDVHSGVISDRRLRQAIRNPYNKQHQFVAHQFSLGDPTQTYIDVAGNKCYNTRVVLRVGTTDIIWFELGEDNQLLLNAKLYNALGIECAQIINNSWRALIKDDTWDITYKGGVLVIKSSLNKVDIKLAVKNDVVYFEGEMLIQGKRFLAKKDALVLVENQVTMTGNSFTDCGCAVWVDEDSVRIGVAQAVINSEIVKASM